MTIDTNDNYSIRNEKKHYSHSTSIDVVATVGQLHAAQHCGPALHCRAAFCVMFYSTSVTSGKGLTCHTVRDEYVINCIPEHNASKIVKKNVSTDGTVMSKIKVANVLWNTM